MSTRVCVVCQEEKILNDFDSKLRGGFPYVDDVCRQCRISGRVTVDTMLNKPHAGGRPRIVLPVEMIKELYAQGRGYKSIASSMKELGYSVSANTIWRVINTY